MESTTFFARHSSGVICGRWFCLYEETSCLACSRPDEDTNIILEELASAKVHTLIHIERISHLPRVGEVSRMPHAAPVGCQIILRPREVPAAGEGGGHLQRRTKEGRENRMDRNTSGKGGGSEESSAPRRKSLRRDHTRAYRGR